MSASAERQARDTKARKRLLGRLREAADENRAFVPSEPRDAMWLRRHLGLDGVLEVERGVFTLAEIWNGLSSRERALFRIKGLASAHPTWGFWGYDAALLWELELPNDLLGNYHIVQTSVRMSLSLGICLMRPQAAGELELVDGVHATSFWRTVEDCLLRAPFSYGLAIADSALRLSGETRNDLLARLDSDCSARRGYRRARAIASYADGSSENGGESRFRAFFIVYGFAEPVLQAEFADPLEKGRTFRVDYLWELEDGGLLIGELDGLDKYVAGEGSDAKADVEAFAAERQRESHLTLLGHRVLRFAFDELKDPRTLIEKLEIAGVPRDRGRSEEWSRRWNGA